MAHNITTSILEPDNWSKMKVKPAEAIMSPRVAEGLAMAYRDSQVRFTRNHPIAHELFEITKSKGKWMLCVGCRK